MPIVYIDKPGISEYLGKFNLALEQVGLTWVGYEVINGINVLGTDQNGINTKVNDKIVEYNPLAYCKKVQKFNVRDKFQDIVSLEVRPMTLDEIDTLLDLWRSITPASRNPTITFQKILDINTQAKGFQTSINAATVWQTLWAIDYMANATWGR